MGVRVALHVTPRSSRDEIVGWRGSELAVRVTAPPADGRANEAVRKLIARALSVPPSNVLLPRGASSRHKQVEIVGLDESDVRAVLGVPDEGLF